MKVNNIESGNYTGYVWYSDAKNPELINGNFIENLSVKNPFIIEGQLYDEEKKISYSIKFVDGEYTINQYEVKSEDYNCIDVEQKEFYANRMEHKKLLFLQYWKEEPDELCEGMNVLQPKDLVFVGFKD